jgi:ATP-binding cassette subfamily B protein
LVRLIEPGAGRILLDGVSIGELPLAWLRQAVAVVPQDTVSFNAPSDIT